MKNYLKFFLALIIGGSFFSLTVQAQQNYKIVSQSSKLVVEGTSTIHDWEIETTEFSAETGLQIDNKSVSQVSYVRFTTPAGSLKSGKSLMDKKIQEALKTNRYPEINFSLQKANAIHGGKATISGQLKIAGKTKEVDVMVHFDSNNPEILGVKGEASLKMSDFNIEQPTAMMGTIKTGDEILVKFDLKFQRSNETLSKK